MAVISKIKGPFNFWCQKVLPAVYDDSLSYYEVLTKTVDYLNKVIEDDQNLIELVNNLETWVNENKEYIDNYFENLNVQNEINVKLDKMAEDGTLGEIIDPILEQFEQDTMTSISQQVADWLQDNITPTTPAIDASLTVSGAGADAKVTGDNITELKNTLNKSTGNYSVTIENGKYISAGESINIPPTPVSNASFACAFVECEGSQIFNIKGHSGSQTNIRMYTFYDAEGNRISQSRTSQAYDEYKKIITPTNAKYIVFNLLTAYDYDVIMNEFLIDTVSGEYEPFNSYEVSTGGYTENGSNTSASAYRRTGDVTFSAGTTVKMTGATYSAGSSNIAAITEWKNGTFVQTLVGLLGSGTTSDPVVGTAEVYFEKETTVRFSWYNSTGIDIQIKNNTSVDNAGSIGVLNTSIKNLPYEWERILNAVCCIGDSLTRGAYYVNGHDGSAIEQNYPYFFAKQTGLSVQNEGMSGSSPSSRWNYFSTYDFTPFNAFFIWWGTNGGLTDTLLEDGVIDSEGNLISNYSAYANTNTGCYCKTIAKIIEQVPHAKIFLANIYTTTGSVATTNEVIQKIAELFSNNVMGVIEMNDGTIRSKVSKILTPSYVHKDNVTHFSMTGNYYLAVHWIKSVRAIIAENPGLFENIMEDILA